MTRSLGTTHLLALLCAAGAAALLHAGAIGRQAASGQKPAPGTPAPAAPVSATPTPAPAPGQQVPDVSTQTFRTRVEMVSVDVNVVDRDGQPLSGLTPSDFEVTVDGKPRRLQTAEFVNLLQTAKPAAAPGELRNQPLRVTWSSNEGAGAAGRLYAIVVDQANIQPGGVRAAGEAARRFVARLAPTDRVALFTIPSGPAVDFTGEHSRVQTALLSIATSAERLQGLWANISVTEALQLQNTGMDACSSPASMLREPLGTIMVRNKCFNREENDQETASCCRQVMTEAMRVVSAIQVASRQTLLSLDALINRLGRIAGPKTVVLLSQRLVTGGFGRLELSSELKRISRSAAEAHISIYVLHLSRGFIDDISAESGGRSDTQFSDETVLREGLETVAGYARGTMLRIVAGADFAFERIARETSAYYLLGFEPLPYERDGKPHQIRVRVPGRRGVDVRSRLEFTISPTTGRDPLDRLVDILRTPGARTLLPMRVATRVLPATRPDRAQVVLASDIGREASTQNVALAYIVTNENGRIVASGQEKRLLEPAEGVFGDLSLRYTVAMELPPGRYRLKLAALDEGGAEGSVEHGFDVRLTDAGPLTLGDLVLASAGASGLVSGLAVDDTLAGGRARGYVQIRPKQEITGPLEVVVEVADTATGRALTSTAVAAGSTKDGLIVADGPVDLRLLPPGNYFARVSVKLDGRNVASRATPFRLVSAVSGSTETTAALSRMPGVTLAVGADRLLLRPFDRRDVLRPAVMSYFVDRLAAASGGAPPAGVADARQSARNANFAELAERLAAVDAKSLDAIFLRGLERYSRGELQAAADDFNAAIEMNVDFLPAIFYLGSCFAAGGKDREAVGAWQAALITEGDARIVYEVLVDALLRLNDVPKAKEILQEARERWQADDALVPRAAAVAAAGREPKAALDLLDPFLEAHPSDSDALFLAMRLIYQASADGKPLVSRQDDAARMVKYAKQYETANGPERAIAERWLTFVRSRQ